MRVKWTLYPSCGQVTPDHISRFPDGFRPLDRDIGPNYVTMYSPEWDAEIQEYIPAYFDTFLQNKTAFDDAFNCSFEAHLEFEGGGEFYIDSYRTRRLANCNVTWHIKQC